MSDDLELGGSALGAGKRKRIEADMDDFLTANNIDELHAEIKRLREENDQKDERIQRMEAERLEQDDKLRQLQAAVEQSQLQT
jgi:Ser-tRNA(Ala) deacylase AlaX